jgi:hypothetical protein
MMTDNEIQAKGMAILSERLGLVEAERFVSILQRETFDYTKWRQENLPKASLTEISAAAMALRNTSSSPAEVRTE